VTDLPRHRDRTKCRRERLIRKVLPDFDSIFAEKIDKTVEMWYD
jgi:hypothetical protein